jgi:hypothetical protein
MTDESRPSCCPSCGCEKVAAIVYGLPYVNEHFDTALQRGEIVLGGCCVMDGMPEWSCNECKHRWGSLEFPPSQTSPRINESGHFH